MELSLLFQTARLHIKKSCMSQFDIPAALRHKDHELIKIDKLQSNYEIATKTKRRPLIIPLIMIALLHYFLFIHKFIKSLGFGNLFSVMKIYLIISCRFLNNIYKRNANCLRIAVDFIMRINSLYKNTSLSVEQIATSHNAKMFFKILTGNDLQFLPIQLLIFGIIIVKTLERVMQYGNDSYIEKYPKNGEKNDVCEIRCVTNIEKTALKGFSDRDISKLQKNNKSNVMTNKNRNEDKNNNYTYREYCIKHFIFLIAQYCEKKYNRRVTLCPTIYFELIEILWHVFDRGKLTDITVYDFCNYIYDNLRRMKYWDQKLGSNSTPLSSSENLNDLDIFNPHGVNCICLDLSRRFIITILLFTLFTLLYMMVINVKTLRIQMNKTTMSKIYINECANFSNQKAGCTFSSSSDASECSTPRISRNAKKPGQKSQSSEMYANFPGSASDLTLNITTPVGKNKRYESGDLGSKSNLDENSDDFYGETKSKILSHRVNPEISKIIPGRKPKQRKKPSKPSSSRYDRGEYIDTKTDEIHYDLTQQKGKTTRYRRSDSPVLPKYIEKGKVKIRSEKQPASPEYTSDSISAESESDDSYQLVRGDKIILKKKQQNIIKSPIESRKPKNEKVTRNLENPEVFGNVNRPTTSTRSEKYRPTGPDRRVFSTLYTNKNICEGSSREAITEPRFNKLRYKADAPKKKLSSKYFQQYIITDESEFTEDDLEQGSCRIRDQLYEVSAVNILQKPRHEKYEKQKGLELHILPESGRKRKPERKSTREFVIDKRKKIGSIQDVDKFGLGMKSNTVKDIINYSKRRPDPPKHNLVRKKRKFSEIQSELNKICTFVPAKKKRISFKTEHSLTRAVHNNSQTIKKSTTPTNIANCKPNMYRTRGDNIISHNAISSFPRINPFNELSYGSSKGRANNAMLSTELKESMKSILKKLESKFGRVHSALQGDGHLCNNEWPVCSNTTSPNTLLENNSGYETKNMFKDYTSSIANTVMFQPISGLSDTLNTSNSITKTISKQCYPISSGNRYHANEHNLPYDANNCSKAGSVRKQNSPNIVFSETPTIQQVKKNIDCCIDAKSLINDIILSDTQKLICDQKNDMTSQIQHCTKTIPETEYFISKNEELLESKSSQNSGPTLRQNIQDIIFQQDADLLESTDNADNNIKKNNFTTLKGMIEGGIEKGKINQFMKCALDIFKILEKSTANTETDTLSASLKDDLKNTLLNIGKNINKSKTNCNFVASNVDSPFDKNILVYNQVTDEKTVNIRNQEMQTVFKNRKNVTNKTPIKPESKKISDSNDVSGHSKKKKKNVHQSDAISNETISTCKTSTATSNHKPESDKGSKTCHICKKKMHPSTGADISKECAVQCSKIRQSGSYFHHLNCKTNPNILEKKSHSVSSSSTNLSFIDMECNPTNTDLSICPYYPEEECSSKCNVCNMIIKHNVKCTSYSSSDIEHAWHSLSRRIINFTDDSEVNVLFKTNKKTNCNKCKFIGTRNRCDNMKSSSHNVEDTASHRSCKFNKLSMNIAVGCNLEKAIEKKSTNLIPTEDMSVLKMSSTQKYPIPPIEDISSSQHNMVKDKYRQLSEKKFEKNQGKLKHLISTKHDNELFHVIPYNSNISQASSQHAIVVVKEDVYSKVKQVCRDTIQKGFQKYSKQYKSYFGKPNINQKALTTKTDISVLEQPIVSNKFGKIVASSGSYPEDSETYILTNNETSVDDIPPPVPIRPYSLHTHAVHKEYSNCPPPPPARKYYLMNSATYKRENLGKNDYSKQPELTEQRYKEINEVNHDESSLTFTRDLNTSDTKDISCDEEINVPRETVFYYTSKKGSQCFIGDVLHKNTFDNPSKESKPNKANEVHGKKKSSVTKYRCSNSKNQDSNIYSLRDSIEKIVNDGTYHPKIKDINNAEKEKASEGSKTTVDNVVETRRLPSKHIGRSRSDFQISLMNTCDQDFNYNTYQKCLEIERFPNELSPPSKKNNLNSSFQKRQRPFKSYKSHSCSNIPYKKKDCKDNILQTDLCGNKKELHKKAKKNRQYEKVQPKPKMEESVNKEITKIKKDHQLEIKKCSPNITHLLGNHNALSTVTNAMCIRSVNEVYFQVPRSNADNRPFSESISLEETEDGSENILLFGDIAVIPTSDKNIEIYFKNTTHLDGVETFGTNKENRKTISSIYTNLGNNENDTKNYTSYGKYPNHELREKVSTELGSAAIRGQFISTDILKHQPELSYETLAKARKPSEVDFVEAHRTKLDEKHFSNLDNIPYENATSKKCSSNRNITEVKSDTDNITPLDSFEDDLYIQSILQECLQKQKCDHSYSRSFSGDNCLNHDLSYGCQEPGKNESVLSNISFSKIETCVNVYDYEDSKIDTMLLEAKTLTTHENINKQTASTFGKYIQNQKEFANMIDEISDCLLAPKVDDYFLLAEPIITEPLDMLGKYKLKDDSLPDKSIKKDSEEYENTSVSSQIDKFPSSVAGESNKDSFSWGDLMETEYDIFKKLPIANLNISDNSRSDLDYQNSLSSDGFNLACITEELRQDPANMKYFQNNTNHRQEKNKEDIMKNNYDALWEQFKDVLQVFRFVEKQGIESQEGQVNTTSNETIGSMHKVTDSNDSIQKLMLDLISGNQFTIMEENMVFKKTKKNDCDLPKAQEKIDSDMVNKEIVEESNMSEIQLKITLDKLETMKERLMKLKGSIWVKENKNYHQSETSDTILRDTSVENCHSIPLKTHLDSNSKPVSSTRLSICKQNEGDKYLRNSCWTRENATQHFINTELYETVMNKNLFPHLNASLSKSLKKCQNEIENESTTDSEYDDLKVAADSNGNMLLHNMPCYPVNYNTVSYDCKQAIQTDTYKFKLKSNGNDKQVSISSFESENINVNKKDKRRGGNSWERLDTSHLHSNRDRRLKKQEVASKTSKSEPSISASKVTFKGWSSKSDRRCSERSCESMNNRYDTCWRGNCLDVGKYAEIGGKIANKEINSSDFDFSEISTNLDISKISVGLHVEDDGNKGGGLFW